VLVIDPDRAARRISVESLENFMVCRVDEAATALRGFEMTLDHPYRLLLLAVAQDGDISGELLDQLITIAHPRCHPTVPSPPPVIFLGAQDGAIARRRDEVRIRAVIPKPLRFAPILQAASGLLAVREDLPASAPLNPSSDPRG